VDDNTDNAPTAEQQSQLKLLIARGKEQGYLTYAEVNDHLPNDIVDPEQIEDIVNMINDMGITVYEKVPDADALLLSDVPGDAPADIASGPTVADPTTCADALAIVQRYRIPMPDAARQLLESGAGESVQPGDPRLARCDTRLIATPRQALQAAAAVARAAGITPHILGDALEGEAREVGKVLAALARESAQHGSPFAPPCVLLSGGETTVTVRGAGVGGRNVEGLLSAALTLQGQPGIWGLMADTDGVDGAVDVAGAIITPDTLQRARALGLNARGSLDANDAHTFFGQLGDSVLTGPTQTNVNDFRALLVLPAS